MTELEKIDGISTLTLVHRKANAMDLEFCFHLINIIKELENDSETKALIITGTGSIFSAGVDLLRLLKEGAPYIDKFLPALSAAIEAFYAFPKPMIAALNGHAIAGGCLLALCADYRVMQEGKGRMGIPELQVGVPFPSSGLAILEGIIPKNKLPDLLYGGDTYLPSDSINYGLLDEITSEGDLIPAAKRKAMQYLRVQEPVFRFSKARLRTPVLQKAAEYEKEFGPEIRRLWSDPETLRVIQDYVNRTFAK